ncbi:MAG: hypothetical protein H7A45_10445 [Verrucomicrobiales bacterium]|nr:hypothetical protein [Verrucomicrobiales bacterium]MCP5528240.1 hypothetical protein [Verrucomicrobiales bacterium]
MRGVFLKAACSAWWVLVAASADETAAALDARSRAPIPLACPGFSGPTGFAVCADGSMQLAPQDDRVPAATDNRGVVTWQFGLPSGPPVEDRWETPGSPFRVMVWEQAGIRYTQTFLMTFLDPEAASRPRQPGGPPLVGLVHLKGENTNSEYADASARLAFSGSGRAAELKLELGIVYRREDGTWRVAGGIDVPTEGIRSPNGPELGFHGHMPPGLTGTMTFKLIRFPLESEAELERLRNLDFDEEYRRARRRWQDGGGRP